MGAPSKRARKIRTKNEFDAARLRMEIGSPYTNYAGFAWNLNDIYAARDQQMLGRFNRAKRLMDSMRTDDAIFVARRNRLAPQRCVGVKIEPAKGARGKAIADEADALYGPKGIAITLDTQAELNGNLADHGVAFGYCTATPRDDGSRIDMTMKSWPIEFVWWDATEKVFKTQTLEGTEERIVHGDGRWIIFQGSELEPWKDGAVIAGALVWGAHAFGLRDWAKGSKAHGNAKLMGQLPQQVPLQDADGNLTPEAASYLQVLKSMMSDELPIGIEPFGAKTDFIVNSSNAWQVFQTLVDNREKAAHRIWCGTDGALGATGGAPGVDIAALLGVGQTIYAGDFGCLERGFNTLIEVWTALNFGDSTLAPTRKFQVADGDDDARAASYATRSTAFYAEINAAKAAGFVVDQDFVETIAEKHGIDAPMLVSAASSQTPYVAPATPAVP